MQKVSQWLHLSPSAKQTGKQLPEVICLAQNKSVRMTLLPYQPSPSHSLTDSGAP